MGRSVCSAVEVREMAKSLIGNIMNDNELDHISYLNWHVRIRNCAGMSPGNFAGTFTGTYIYTGRTILVFILLSCERTSLSCVVRVNACIYFGGKATVCLDNSCTT